MYSGMVVMLMAIPTQANLLLHYDFNNNLVNQANPGTNDGSFFGNANFGAGPNSTIQFASQFDGDDDAVLMGDINFLEDLTTMTVAGFYRRDVDNPVANDTNHAVNNVMFANSSNSGNDNFEIGTQGNIIQVYLDTGGGGANDATRTFDTTGFGGINDGQWYHLAFTFDAADDPNEGSVYLDGILIGSASWNGADIDASNNNQASLGMARHTNNRFGELTGAIADFRIFDEALTLDQIAELAATTGVPEPATATLALFGVAALVRRRRAA